MDQLYRVIPLAEYLNHLHPLLLPSWSQTNKFELYTVNVVSNLNACVLYPAAYSQLGFCHLQGLIYCWLYTSQWQLGVNSKLSTFGQTSCHDLITRFVTSKKYPLYTASDKMTQKCCSYHFCTVVYRLYVTSYMYICRNVKKTNSCEKTYLLPISQGMELESCFQSTPHGEVATDTQFTGL